MTVPQKIRKHRKAHSRERLITAAGKLFAEFGYDDTTLESVADMAGLHVQTLYRHFPTKDELSASLMHENLTKFETFFHARECDALGAWRDWVERTARAGVRHAVHVSSVAVYGQMSGVGAARGNHPVRQLLRAVKAVGRRGRVRDSRVRANAGDHRAPRRRVR